MVIDCDKRAAMIRKSKFNQLSSKAKEKMVSHPQPGQVGRYLGLMDLSIMCYLI